MPIIPNSERTPQQLREMGRRGGIESGRVRRAKARKRAFIQENYEAINGVLAVADLAYITGARDPLQIAAIFYSLFEDLSLEELHDLLTDEAMHHMGISPERANKIRSVYRMLQREKRRVKGRIL